MDIASYLSDQQTLLNSSIGSSSDNTDKPTTMTRYMGGHNRTNQPYISGYHQIVVSPPAKLFEKSDASAVSSWLTSTCESFTPHSVTVNMVDLMGIGQVGSSFPVSKTVNREFTLGFREYRNLPILNIFRTWNSLFDSHVGISTLSAKDFIPQNYKGWIMVATMKPTSSNGIITAEDLEDLYMYEGVFPMTVPEDTISAADQGTNDTVQASITFKFDGAPLTRSYGGGTELVNSFIDYIRTRSYSDVYTTAVGSEV
jgi:hypothetical protein